jgi:transmembrane sensor
MRFSRTKSIRIEAAEWVATLREGGGTAEERRRFVDWLQESPRHVAEYLEIASLWHDAGEAAASIDTRVATDDADGAVVIALRPIEPELGEGHTDDAHDPAVAGPAEPPAQRTDSGHERRSSRAGRRRSRAAVGVGALAAVIAAGWWLAHDREAPVEYRTGVGEQRSLPLTDGSLISLNTQSRMRVDLRASARRVELIAGEALFDVAPDSSRPFIVTAGGTEIQAIGTSFNVYRQSDDTVAVTVLEGRVALRSVAPESSLTARAAPRRNAEPRAAEESGRPDVASPGSSPTGARPAVVELGSGERAYVGPAAVDVVATPANVEQAIAWMERRLIFENDALEDVIAEFNRYNVDKLDVLDRELAELRLSAVFQAHDPESLLEFLQRSQNVRVVRLSNDRRVLLP